MGRLITWMSILTVILLTSCKPAPNPRESAIVATPQSDQMSAEGPLQLTSAKTLRGIQDSLDTIPSTAVIRQQYDTLDATVDEAPDKLSEQEQFWSDFYKRKDYRDLENLVAQFADAKWLSAKDHVMLGAAFETLTERRTNSEYPPLPKLEEAFRIVNQRADGWETVIDDFKNFHVAIEKRDLTVHELDRVYNKLRGELKKQEDTEAATELLVEVSKVYQSKQASINGTK